jgi:hypothetical protein
MLDIKPIKERLNILLSDIPEWVIKDLQQLTEELERTRFLLNLKDERVEELKRKLNEQPASAKKSIYVGDFNGYKYYLSPANGTRILTYTEAVNYCSSLVIDGHSDWCLPSKEELNFLYENRANLPSGEGFVSSVYWSSTEASSTGASSTGAWYQNFDSGGQYYSDGKPYSSYVRAIRKEKLKDEQTESEESVYVGDLYGYKYYLSPINTERWLTWQDAINYCSSLNIDGHTDWYLPSNKELNFLCQTKLPATYHLLILNHSYWTSTEDQTDASALAYYYHNGSQYSGLKTNSNHVCAIRKENLKDEQTEPEESIYVGDFNGYKYFLSPKNTEHLKTWREAQNYCSSLTIDGHNDWHLPNKDELNFLYKNKDSLHLGEGFIPTTYWSSTEHSSAYAWDQYFVNGIQNLTTKRFLLYARAIRKEKI